MLEMLTLMGTVFLGSFLVARALVMAKKNPSGKLELKSGIKLKLVTASGAYRCHVESAGKRGIVTSVPLFRDSYVPLRVGEKILVQAAYDDRLLTFRTVVLARDGVYHRLTLANPTAFRNSERRSEQRRKSFEKSTVVVNKSQSHLLDISSWGARLQTPEPLSPGDLVYVEWPPESGEVSGSVLDSKPVLVGNRMGREVRIRFDEKEPSF